jgi:hypothetical protein
MPEAVCAAAVATPVCDKPIHILAKKKLLFLGPKFKCVYFDELPTGCLPIYDYNNEKYHFCNKYQSGIDIPYTLKYLNSESFDFNKNEELLLLVAKNVFGCTPPEGQNRVYLHLMYINTIEQVQEMSKVITNLDKDFCAEREMIVGYRDDDFPQLGILIRKPLVITHPNIYKESFAQAPWNKQPWYKKLINRKNKQTKSAT